MSKTRRIISLVLVLAMALSLMTVFASAISVSGRNKYCVVETGKSPFYTHAKIKIKNTGSTKMTINVEKSDGSLFKSVTIKAGKSTTISLRDNQTFYVYWSGDALTGAFSATGTLSDVQYINSIY